MSLAPRARIFADVATEVVKNLGMQVPPIRAWRARRRRTMGDHGQTTNEVMESLVFTPLEAMLKELPRERLRGATVVEIGPGDNVVLGLALLALGARQYHAIDRFMGDVNGPRARRLYSALGGRLPGRLGATGDEIPDSQAFPEDLLDDKVFLHRRGIEQYRSMDLALKADLVFSNDVGQFTALPEAMALATQHFLKPGGTGVHTIQFGPVGCWTLYRNPLTFLTLPEKVWKWTSGSRGSANRARYHEFLAMFSNCGLTVRTEILQEFTKEQVEEVRPYLDRSFEQAPLDSLRARYARFVCRKPLEES